MVIWKKKSINFKLHKLIKTFNILKNNVIYCLKCRKNTEVKPKNGKTKKGRLMLLSNCEVFDSKKVSGLSSSLGKKTPFRKIPGPRLFKEC